MNGRAPLCVIAAVGAIALAMYAWAQDGTESSKVERLETQHLPNAVRVHERVLSGGLPEGDEGFAELKQLGVKTVISVDGAPPDVETARRHGLRYVHLPHGYDGISAERTRELAKAVLELPGPVYIHCHHGKHRSPAAAAVACITSGLVPPQQARSILETAGTSPHYRGLYRDAGAARAVERTELANLDIEFQALVAPPPMVEAMVEIEKLHDRIKTLAARDWRPLRNDPDNDPAHVALLLREQFTELLRSEQLAEYPGEFRQLAEQSETTTRGLEDALKRHRDNRGAEQPLRVAAEQLRKLTEGCTACHQAYRD